MTNNIKIKETKEVFKPLLKRLSHSPHHQDIFSEAAFPAYAHRNPLIDFLFWRRLTVVAKYLVSRKATKVLDFGCGSGVMSYLLALSGIQTVGTDIEPAPLKEVLKSVIFPRDFSFVDSQQLQHQPNDFDAIIALDVLEHTANPLEEVKKMAKHLKPGGEIVVCGPTENVFYKIGRFISGKRFTGTYHKTNIVDIGQVLSQKYKVHTIKTLYRPIPLFEIFSVSP